MSNSFIRFCTDCDKKVEVYTEMKETFSPIRGTLVSFNEKFAKCKYCGKLLYVPEVNDENVRSINLAYKRMKQISSS